MKILKKGVIVGLLAMGMAVSANAMDAEKAEIDQAVNLQGLIKTETTHGMRSMKLCSKYPKACGWVLEGKKKDKK